MQPFKSYDVLFVEIASAIISSRASLLYFIWGRRAKRDTLMQAL